MHAPQIGRRRQAGQIADDAAAQGHHRVPAGQAVLAQEAVQIGQLIQALGRFAVGQHDAAHPQPGAFQRGHGALQIQGGHVVIGDDGDGHLAQALQGVSAQAVQHAAADVDGVGAVPQGDGDHGHGVPPVEFGMMNSVCGTKNGKCTFSPHTQFRILNS